MSLPSKGGLNPLLKRGSRTGYTKLRPSPCIWCDTCGVHPKSRAKGSEQSPLPRRFEHTRQHLLSLLGADTRCRPVSTKASTDGFIFRRVHPFHRHNSLPDSLFLSRLSVKISRVPKAGAGAEQGRSSKKFVRIIPTRIFIISYIL